MFVTTLQNLRAKRITVTAWCICNLHWIFFAMNCAFYLHAVFVKCTQFKIETRIEVLPEFNIFFTFLLETRGFETGLRAFILYLQPYKINIVPHLFRASWLQKVLTLKFDTFFIKLFTHSLRLCTHCSQKIRVSPQHAHPFLCTLPRNSCACDLLQ